MNVLGYKNVVLYIKIFMLNIVQVHCYVFSRRGSAIARLNSSRPLTVR